MIFAISPAVHSKEDSSMKFLWPVLLVIFRALYFVYSVWCLLFPLAAIWFFLTLSRQDTLLGLSTSHWHQALLGAFLLFGISVLVTVHARRGPDDPNPFQSAFLSWFGTLRGFWNRQGGDQVKLSLPSGYLVENPPAYRIGGIQMQEILGAIEEGDILLRGYDGYVDGFMIRHASVCSKKGFQPGWFTHAAIYMGTLNDEDQKSVPAPFQQDPGYFKQGKNMVIHAMAKGVHCQDLLTFCRSDYLVVLRMKPGLNGLEAKSVVADARRSALEKIGKGYDFDASDTQTFSRFSCSELVYYCFRSVRDALKIEPQPHALYPLSPLNKTLALLKRVTIVPDDFYALLQQGSVECIWQDPISTRRHAAPDKKAT
jgi:hypothetical protein